MPRVLDVDEAPRADYLLEWRDILLQEWNTAPFTQGENDDMPNGSLDDQQGEEEDLYFQRFGVDAPHGKMGFRTGSAASDADAAIDSLMPVDILIDVRKKRDRKKFEEQSRKLKLLARAMIWSWKRPRNEIRRIISDQVIRRVGVCRLLYDDSLFPDPPDRLAKFAEKPPVPKDAEFEEDFKVREKAYRDRFENWRDDRAEWETKHRVRSPIILEHRNPRQVRWRDNRGQLMVVVEDYQTTVLEAIDTYDSVDGSCIRKICASRNADDTVHISDVWIGKWRGIFVEDEPVFDDDVREHGYPRIPYFIIPFRELPFENPALRYRGMLTNSRDLYPMESQVLTMNVWLLAWNAWRSWKGWLSDNRELAIVPGEMVTIDQRKGEYLEMMDGRPVPPELLQMASVVDSYIQRNGVAQGPRTVEGTRSGQQVWAIQAMRQMKIESAKEALQIALEDMLAMGCQIIELMIKESLTLPVPGRDEDGKDYGDVTVGPEDINGYYHGFEVSFSRRLDPALIEQAKALMAMSVNNWMPLKVAYQYSGLTENPQEWIDELLEQATDRMDFMLEYAALERARQAYGEDSDEYKLLWSRIYKAHMDEAQQAEAGAAGGGGAPGPASQGKGSPGIPSGGAITPSSPTGPGEGVADMGTPDALAEAGKMAAMPQRASRSQGKRTPPPWTKPASGGAAGGGSKFTP